MMPDPKPNFIEELTWRGMLQDKMPGFDAQLAKESTAGYIGFDPTAASLHIGNLATIMLLVLIGVTLAARTFGGRRR